MFDNRYVADCLRRFPGRFAAIGLVAPKAPDAPDRLEKLVREDGFGGLRIHSSRLDHPSEWAASDQDPLWRRSEELGTCFIVHGPAANLPHCGADHWTLSRGAGGVGPHRYVSAD